MVCAACPAQRPDKVTFTLDKNVGPGEVRCGPVRRDNELIGGPGAYGQVGRAFRCNNAKLRFLVQDASRPIGVSSRGGNLIDVDVVRLEGSPGQDTFREHASAIGVRELAPDSVEVKNDGTNGEPGIIRVRGRPADLTLAPQAALLAQDLHGTLINDYVLYPDADYIEVRTTFINEGEPVFDVVAADFLAFGGLTTSHTPALGFGAVPVFSEVPYFSSTRGPGVSYAWVCEGENAALPLVDASTTAPFCGSGVAVGSERTFIRWLVVGDGSLQSTTRTALTLRDLPYGDVVGSVVSRDGTAVSGAYVSALTAALTEPGAHVQNEAITNNAGAFVLSLPEGDYVLVAHTPERARGSGTAVRVAVAGEANVGALDIGDRAHLVVTTAFVDVDGGVAPAQAAKLVLVPGAGTQLPSDVLDDFHAGAVSHYQVSADGAFAVDVPAGNYTAYVSRGFDWERAQRDVNLIADASVSIEMTLVRSFQMRGIVSAEMHQHSLGSVDARVPIATKVLENAAEGVQVAVSTDHDNIIDFAPHVAALGLQGQLVAFAGNEVSYTDIGHFNVYPFDIDPADPLRDVGARLWWLKNIPTVFADARSAAAGDDDAIVQINHPRAGITGYFTSLRLNPVDATRFVQAPPRYTTLPADIYSAWAGNFDAVEVNGNLGTAAQFTRDAQPALATLADQHPSDVPSLADYFALLGAGMTVSAVGNSDSHQLNEGVGYPRNFLFVPNDDVTQITAPVLKAAIRAQRVAVGEGCVAQLQVDGVARMGQAELTPTLNVDARFVVLAPSFVSVGSVEVYVNGVVQPLVAQGQDIAIDATGVLSLPLADPPAPRPTKRTNARLLGLADVATSDAVVVVLARDGAGLQPTGNGAVFCFTPPLYLDADGDGAWTPYLALTQTIAP